MLQKLQTDTAQKFAWSIIDQDDFQQTGTTSKDLTEVIDELIFNIPNIQLTALFYQTPNGQYALIKSANGLNLLEAMADYQPQGAKDLVKIKIEPSSADDLIFHLQSLIK